MSDHGAPTLDDVARHARVHPATACRALSRPELLVGRGATVDERKVAPALVIRSSTAAPETA